MQEFYKKAPISENITASVINELTNYSVRLISG